MFTNTSLLRVSVLAASLAFGGCAMLPGGTAEPAPQAKSTASADTAVFSATLSAAAEVPPNSSMANGKLDATLDKKTSVLRWKLTYSGLTGPATMVHFHAPAMPGANAGVVLPFPSAASGVNAEGTLTPAQVTDLMAGKWYVNVHTAANPGGEIRGQLVVR